MKTLETRLLMTGPSHPFVSYLQNLCAELAKKSGTPMTKVYVANPLQPPVLTDVLFHLDTPIGVWMPWARLNILVLSSPAAVAAAVAVPLQQFDAIFLANGTEAPELKGVFALPSNSSNCDEIATWWKSTALPSIKARRSTKQLPPILAADASSCPHISIVTLIYNRRKFVDLAFHNSMITDYPKEKIEWVIVDDSDVVEEQATDKILKFARSAAPMSVTYIPLDKKTPISEKRNLAIERAQHEIILMMDDDDHYPETSARRRVAWLTKGGSAGTAGVQAVACTMIACYDLLKGRSYVTIPPFDLPLSKRVSEATLTFYKSWWQKQKFAAATNMAEGEGLCVGREHEILEIPPQQIIVAMSHGKNASSRHLPDTTAEPSCFWGFPKEFLIFLHGLAGVRVESTTSR